MCSRAVKIERMPWPADAGGSISHCPLGLISSRSWICDKLCKVEPPCIMKRKYQGQLLDTTIPPKPIDYYDIPYGSLVPRTIDNLLVSGR